MEKIDKTTELFSNDLNLAEILLFFRRSFKIISISALIFSSLGVIYSLSLEDKYTSFAKVIPSALDQSRSQGGLSAISSIAGLGLGQNNVKVLIAKETINSTKFLNNFLSGNFNGPNLIAATQWNKDTRELIFDPEVYDTNKSKWTYRNKLNSDLGPTKGELRDAFLSRFTAEEDDSSQVMTLTFTHVSPDLAQEILTEYILDINKAVRQQDLIDSQDRYNFLKEKYAETNVQGIKQSISSLIEEELKVMTLLINKDYAFKVIDPPALAEKKSGPFRSIICIYFAIFGVFIGLIFALCKKYFF